MNALVILLAVIAFIALLVICYEAGFDRFAYGWLFFLLALVGLVFLTLPGRKAEAKCAVLAVVKGGAQ